MKQEARQRRASYNLPRVAAFSHAGNAGTHAHGVTHDGVCMC